MDRVVTKPFEPAARDRVNRYLSRRLTNLPPNVELARQNAERFVEEAATEATRRGCATVDLDAVDAAWRHLCPGLYPFC